MAGGAAVFLSSKLLTAFSIASAAPSSSARTAIPPSAAAAAAALNRSIPLLSLSASSSSSSSSSPSSALLLSSSSNLGVGSIPIRQRQRQHQRQQAAMASSDAASSVPKIQKSEEEWRTVLSPEQFRILRLREPSGQVPGSTINSRRLDFTRAPLVERLSISRPLNSTQAVAGRLSLRDYPALSKKQSMRMGGELRSHAQPVEVILGHNFKEHGNELLAEEVWEGLEKWTRGGGVVHKLAQVDESVVVEFGAVIHAHAIIGADTQISSGSVVGSHVVIGSHSKLGFNVALQNCSVGNSCILHSGVCVGQDGHCQHANYLAAGSVNHGWGGVPLDAIGFGFTINDKGEMVKKPQMLKVRIGNNVEIGANSCIDRGSWRDTSIGDHTKIDNLVQVGHNVVIGRCCMLCGQVGLAGSSTLGDYVVMGGKSGVADHVSVASKVRIAAKSAVTSNIVEPGDYAGFPAVPAKEWRRSVVHFRKLGKLSQVVNGNATEV